MAKLVGLFLVLAFIVGVVAAARPATVGSQANGECNNDLKDLIQDCKQFVMFPANPKMSPSKACCGVVQKVNMPCMCSKVTKEVEKIVCMEKVVYVSNYCKRPLKPGYKCGSYTVPHMGQ